MEFLTTLHGHNRWLIILFAVLAVITLILNRKDPSEYKKNTRLFGSIYAYALALQFIIGLILFFQKHKHWNGTCLLCAYNLSMPLQ